MTRSFNLSTFRFLAALAVFAALPVHAQLPQRLWVPENGWYGELVRTPLGNALGDRGRGVYFETQGSIGVITIMTYEADGRPVMLYAAGPLQAGVACVGLSVSEFTQFETCIRNAELFRISGGVPLGQRGVPAQPPRIPELVGHVEFRAGLDFISLSIQPPNPGLPPGGVWPDQMRLQRLQWGYGGFGGNLPIGGGPPDAAFPMPGACIPDFRGDWVMVEPADRSRPARRLVFDQMELLDPAFTCAAVVSPELAQRVVVVFRDSQQPAELRCIASGCGFWDAGAYVGWVPRGYELKRFSLAVGVPLLGQPISSWATRRLVAYRVE